MSILFILEASAALFSRTLIIIQDFAAAASRIERLVYISRERALKEDSWIIDCTALVENIYTIWDESSNREET
jgi:hypothetical protein